jgi:hypothetical protein
LFKVYSVTNTTDTRDIAAGRGTRPADVRGLAALRGTGRVPE